MNWDRLEGRWKQQRGRAVYRWGKVMNDELSAILGRYEELVGKLQEKYGIAKDEATHRVDEYKIIVGQLKQANRELIKLHKSMNGKKKPVATPANTSASSKKRSSRTKHP